MEVVNIDRPRCFDPIGRPTRSLSEGGGDMLYKDLSNHELTNIEKYWLCKQVDVLNCNETGKGIGKKYLIKRYNISRHFFRHNYATFRNTGNINAVGRQHLLQPADFAPIANEIIKLNETGVDMSEVEVRKLMDKVATDKSYKNGKPRKGAAMTNRTFVKAKDRLNLQTKKAGTIDQSAINARKCPIMSYIWYLIVAATSQYLPASCKWNIDGTTYVFDTPKKGSNIIRLLDQSEYTLDNDEIAPKNVKMPNQGKIKTPVGYGLPYGIKVMQAINAFSESSSFTCIVSVRDMEPDDWHVEEVLGLSNTTEVGAKGYIYFSKTRGKPAAMWHDYFTRIVLPSIKASRDYHMERNEEGELHDSELSLDNEAIIIDCIYKEDLMVKFNLHHIHVISLGPGTTGCHQVCDRCPTFASVKKAIAKMNRDNVEIKNDPLERNILKAFNNLEVAKPYLKGKIKNSYKLQITRGLLLLNYVYPKYLSRDAIQSGYRVTGQHLYEANPDGTTISFEAIMKNCYSDVSTDQMELMKRMAPQFIDQIQRTGMVNYTDIIAAGILPGTTSKDRDDLCHTHQFPKIVTHAGSVQRFAAEKEKKTQEYKDAITKEKNLNKEIMKAQKVVEAHDRSNALKELKKNEKRQRDEDEAAENAKYEKMSKFQKIKYDKVREENNKKNTQELTRSRNEQKAHKQLKAEEKAKELADARSLLHQNSQSDFMEESDSSND